jgi:hypothetical protein
MPLSEYDERSSAGCHRLARSIGTSRQRRAREGIADTIPLVMMGMVEPNDLDDLAEIVEERGRAVHDAATPEDVQRAQLKEAVKAAFDRYGDVPAASPRSLMVSSRPRSAP